MPHLFVESNISDASPNSLQLSNFAGQFGWKDGRKMLRRDEVFDNIRWLEVKFPDAKPGRHTLKLIMIDPEIVIETIVVNPDNNRYSYFGNIK